MLTLNHELKKGPNDMLASRMSKKEVPQQMDKIK
jgi:hypothetical protein